VGEAGTVVGEGMGVGMDVASVPEEASFVGKAVARGKVIVTEGAGLLLAIGGCAVAVAGGTGVGVGAGGVEQPARTNTMIASNR
jgi:hypothetical protein